MKTFSVLLFFGLLLAGCGDLRQGEPQKVEDVLPENLTDEEKALLKDVREMFERQDISAMLERVHREGVEDWWMEIEEEYLQDVLEKGLERIELIRIYPPRTEVTLVDGTVAEWSLPLKWELKIYHPQESPKIAVSHTIHLSEQDGRIVSIRQIQKD